MPYKSKSQAAFIHAAMERGDIKPSVVHEFDKASKGKMGKLPEHVKKMSKGGMVCMHCGGSVDAEGYASGGEVEIEFELPEEEKEVKRKALFHKALKGSGWS